MDDEVKPDHETENVEDALELADAVEPVTEAVPPDFGELSQPSTEEDPAVLAILHELPMPVAIELGRTTMSVQEVLALGRGSVIQLDRLAGEPIDVFVGDRRFAEGEVVIIGEQFGIRITHIVGSPSGEFVA